MEEKNKRVIIVSIVALAIVLITASYAYFSARITGLENASTISMTAGRMGIVYSEGDENVIVQNIYPREDAWITKTFTLTGYNTTGQPMRYDLGIYIYNNTFKGGELTYTLTGVGENGTRIPDIDGKALVGHDRFLKFGTGSFNASDGDTHVYTLKIYFKDTGRNQNYNQGAVFNGKITVKEDTALRCYADASELKPMYEKLLSYDINEEICNIYAEKFIDDSQQRSQYCNGETVTITYDEGTDYEYTRTFSLVEEVSEYGWDDMYLQGIIENLVFDTSSQYYFTEYSKGRYLYRFFDYSISSEYLEYDAPENGFLIKANKSLLSDPITDKPCIYLNDMPLTSMDSTFYGSRASSIDLSSFDTSNVTNMGSMFRNTGVDDLDLRKFNTSKVTNMSSMFQGSQITSLDLSGFDTSNVTYMSGMFGGSLATSIDLSSFDTSKVTDMVYMFENSKATTLDLSGFDTSNVTAMAGMFSGTKVQNLDLRKFNTSKVINMNAMFSGSQATSIDLSSFDKSNVTTMNGMFNNCSNLKTIYASNKFVTTSLNAYAGSTNMFKNATELVGGAGTTYNSSKTNKEYARIDGGTSNPGYFTDIKDKPSN